MIYIKGSEIRRQRQEVGMSLASVSALSGVDPGLLSRYERCEYEPSGDAQCNIQLAIAHVRELQRAFAPARLDCRNIEGLKDLVGRLERGEFSGYARITGEKLVTLAKIKAAGEAQESF